MATVVNSDSGGSAAGWAMALIVLAVVIVGAIFLFGHGGGAASPGTNINVTAPSGGSGY
jgi:hypothetical protein